MILSTFLKIYFLPNCVLAFKKCVLGPLLKEVIKMNILVFLISEGEKKPIRILLLNTHRVLSVLRYIFLVSNLLIQDV